MARHSCPVRIRPATTFTVAKAEPSSRAPAVVPGRVLRVVSWSRFGARARPHDTRLHEQGSALTDPDAHLSRGRADGRRRRGHAPSAPAA